MSILLLLIIYIAFISLGLPDSMLGSSFPAIAENLNIASDMAGYIALTVSACTIVSSLFSAKLIEKFSTKWVVFVSVLLTATGLVLFSQVKEGYTWLFFLIAVPMGLGAGAIDAALNNYVALHYKAIHMNWLHCSWGIGASIGPMILGSFIDSDKASAGWDKGVLIISIIQFSIALIILISLPLWNKMASKESNKPKEEIKQVKKFSYKDLFKNPVFYLSMIGFFGYCALETTTGLWTGSFFSYGKGLSTSKAATLTSVFYLGITVGRFICGPISLKFKEKNMMRIGESILLVGTVLTMIPFNIWFSIIGLSLIGIGCAPIYPAIIRSTPYRFSKEASQKAMGIEMAIAYCGNLSIPPLFGLIAKSLGNNFSILPYMILALLLLMIIVHEIINAILQKRDVALTEEEKKEYF